MAKRRARKTGIHWRRDLKKYVYTYKGKDGTRIRKVGSINRDETEKMRAADITRDQEPEPGPADATSVDPAVAEPPHEWTVDEAADRFLAYQRPRLKSEKGYQREVGVMKIIKAQFPGKLADITRRQVSDFVTAELARVKPSTVKKEFISFKHMLRLCYDEWELLPENHPDPTRKVKLPKIEDDRTRFIEPEQFLRLLAALPEKVRPVIALLTASGMRRSEPLLARRRHVQGTRLELPAEICKSRRPRSVHLNAFAQRILASLPSGEPDDLLFPGLTPAGVSMAFHRTCQTLKIHDPRLHDLRHCFATWLRRRGVDLDTLAEQLGHADTRMTRRYAHIAPEQLPNRGEHPRFRAFARRFAEFTAQLNLPAPATKLRSYIYTSYLSSPCPNLSPIPKLL